MKNKPIHKKKKFLKEKESVRIKVLDNVDKTAQNCYKKVEELCEAAPYCWVFAPDSYSV